MDVTFERATLDDIDELVSTRLEVMREVWALAPEEPLDDCAAQTRAYFAEALPTGAHTAYLLHDGDEFVGCGGVSYYRVMPTCDNPTGRKAYIMNMYVRAPYRRRGLASQLLTLLLEDCTQRGVDFVSLEASDDGRPLYASFGFEKMEDEMLLRLPASEG